MPRSNWMRVAALTGLVAGCGQSVGTEDAGNTPGTSACDSPERLPPEDTFDRLIEHPVAPLPWFRHHASIQCKESTHLTTGVITLECRMLSERIVGYMLFDITLRRSITELLDGQEWQQGPDFAMSVTRAIEGEGEQQRLYQWLGEGQGCVRLRRTGDRIELLGEFMSGMPTEEAGRVTVRFNRTPIVVRPRMLQYPPRLFDYYLTNCAGGECPRHVAIGDDQNWSQCHEVRDPTTFESTVDLAAARGGDSFELHGVWPRGAATPTSGWVRVRDAFGTDARFDLTTQCTVRRDDYYRADLIGAYVDCRGAEGEPAISLGPGHGPATGIRNVVCEFAQ